MTDTPIPTLRGLHYPRQADLTLPYPHHITPAGAVWGQEFWRGDPATLIGFQTNTCVQHVDLHVDDWLAGDPDAAIGMFPVFTDDDGLYTFTLPVERVDVLNPSNQGESS